MLSVVRRFEPAADSRSGVSVPRNCCLGKYIQVKYCSRLLDRIWILREHDVRYLLYCTEIKERVKQNAQVRVVDEFQLLRGQGRIDVALIDNALHGYEIKSATDNLDRLPSQQAIYNKVFDRITLVADERHVEEAVPMVPKHWGLIVVGMKDCKPYADTIWPAMLNHDHDKLALAQLLWRDEVLELMEYFDIATGFKSANRKRLWRRISDCLTVEQIKAFVCFKLRTRKDWRAERHQRSRNRG
jgi:hypothetical protein